MTERHRHTERNGNRQIDNNLLWYSPCESLTGGGFGVISGPGENKVPVSHPAVSDPHLRETRSTENINYMTACENCCIKWQRVDAVLRDSMWTLYYVTACGRCCTTWQRVAAAVLRDCVWPLGYAYDGTMTVSRDSEKWRRVPKRRQQNLYINKY